MGHFASDLCIICLDRILIEASKSEQRGITRLQRRGDLNGNILVCINLHYDIYLRWTLTITAEFLGSLGRKDYAKSGRILQLMGVTVREEDVRLCISVTRLTFHPDYYPLRRSPVCPRKYRVVEDPVMEAARRGSLQRIV